MPSTHAPEHEAGIKPHGRSVERLKGLSGHQNRSEGARLLPVQLHLAVDVDAANMDDPRTPVDVSPLERQPLFRPEP